MGMKKRILFIFVLFVAVLALSACAKDESSEIEGEYHYSGITFERAEGLSFDDVKPLISSSNIFHFDGEINTISDVENFIRENIDVYYITKTTDQGQVRVGLKNFIEEITIAGETVVLSGSGESLSFAYTIQGNALCLDYPDGMVKYDFFFRSGKICYEIELIEGFTLVHEFSRT